MRSAACSTHWHRGNITLLRFQSEHDSQSQWAAAWARQTKPTPAEDWRTATVDVVIPALNEAREHRVVSGSVARQTLRPRRIILVDDGSTDGTIDRAKRFARQQQLELIAIQRRAPIGKRRRSNARRASSTRMSSSFSTATRFSNHQLHRTHRSGALSGRRHRAALRHDPPVAPT